MEQNKSFKDSIAENTNADGGVNWDKVEIPDLDIKDWSDITDVPPHAEDALLTRFGDDAAKVRQLLTDHGPIDFGLRDLEHQLADATEVVLKDIMMNLDEEFTSQDIIEQIDNKLVDYTQVKEISLIFTCNPEKPLITLHKLIGLSDYLGITCWCWAVQYNDTLPIDTLNITMIITQ